MAEIEFSGPCAFCGELIADDAGPVRACHDRPGFSSARAESGMNDEKE